MTHRVWLIFLLTISIACSNVNKTDRPPNIVMILGDDQGYPYYGFMGSEHIYTPNLDTLAAQGIVFTNCHVTASVCPPSLRTLLTGLYPYQFDFIKNKIKSKDADDELHVIINFKTLPEVLSEAGYVSFEGGKTWEGTYMEQGFTAGMTKERNKGEVKQHGAIYAMAGGDGLKLGRVTNQPVYDFIDQYQDSSFYIWYAPMLPHTPHDPPDKFTKLYEGKGFSEASVKYYANITRLDHVVGELLDYLDKKGLRENTLIFYLSDNGYEQGPQDPFDPMGPRRGKASLHEMGFRTPLIFSWPGKIEPGRVNKDFVSSTDIFPTLLDYAGVPIPEDLPGYNIQGSIEGNEPVPRDRLIGSMNQLRISEDRPRTGKNPYANDEMSFYITTKKWHFISYEDRGQVALYDQTEDPFEKNNVAEQHPELVKKFLNQIENWKRKIVEPFTGSLEKVSVLDYKKDNSDR